MPDARRRPASSLAEEHQQLTRSRIRQAAMEVVARRGFDATVDEIAELSGVSPRTVFRHYATHDRLIAATVRDMFEASGRYPLKSLPRLVDDLEGWIEGLPRRVEDLDAWLEGLAVTVHTRNARVFGEAFWDIHGPNCTASPELAEVAALRRRYRLRGIEYLVALAWHSAGGEGEPPEFLHDAFALHLSAFTTQALMVDFDQTPAQIGALTARTLRTLLAQAIQERRAAPAPV